MERMFRCSWDWSLIAWWTIERKKLRRSGGNDRRNYGDANGSLHLLEDSVERDRVRSNRRGVRAGGKLRKCSSARSLLENLHFAVIDRRAWVEDVVIPRETIHPGRALNRRLGRCDDRKF